MVALEQSALPTLRDRADFPSCGVVASLLGHYPIASAPPCLRGNLPRSRPRGILRQAPSLALTPCRGGIRPPSGRPAPARGPRTSTGAPSSNEEGVPSSSSAPWRAASLPAAPPDC